MSIFTGKKRRLILAVESSCDETSVAIVEDGNHILSNVVASQVKSHKRFGGVVPEVASRHHVEEILDCMEEALTKAGVKPSDLGGVAVTYGPGLVGALLIGLSSAKAFAFSHSLPLIPVNHMAGHIQSGIFVKDLKYPLMALLVSGGHTELVYMEKAGDYRLVGETRDDACGEAYDKVGRVLGLAYPSGRELDELAHQGQDTLNFPRAMLKEDNFDFSFSGLKSAVVNYVHNANQRQEIIEPVDLAASFQASVVDVLITKTLKACEHFKVKQLVVAGGVAANQELRERLEKTFSEKLPAIEIVFPPLALCGDNAAMIAAAGFIEAEKGNFATLDLNAEPGLCFAGL